MESKEVISELAKRGHIAGSPAPDQLATGNRDRLTADARSAWRVSLPDTTLAKLTIGPSLRALAARHQAFAEACPTISTKFHFHLTLADTEILAEEYFSGSTLEAAIQRGFPAKAIIVPSFDGVRQALAASRRVSTEEARLKEWRTWSAALARCTAFDAAEQEQLTSKILPRLYPLLATDSPETRWTNGDFVPDNILINDSGETRLIDTEFAQRTHFYHEDAVRCLTLSTSLRSHPNLFSSSLHDPGPAWHLYFWLRQLQLEAAGNSAQYWDQIRVQRLGIIRRLSEYVLKGTLDDWSVAATPIEWKLEIARWKQTATSDLLLSGWCHLPSSAATRAIRATTGNLILCETAPSARKDVQDHFAAHPQALASGFSLLPRLPQPDCEVLLSAISDDGILLPFHTLNAGDLPGQGPHLGDYSAWAARYDPDPPAPTTTPDGPLISILLPVYQTPPHFLRECLQSVFNQHYTHWELIVVDDGSTSPDVKTVLGEFTCDPRLHVHFRSINGGISRATNDALFRATGDYIVLLDHDDMLRPHALAVLATSIQQAPRPDALYSDEDKITAEGVRSLPFVKPDFSPEFLLGVMYIGHVLCVRTTIARAAGGFDPTHDGVQDYEFFLRVTELTRNIIHIPRILYHWRQSPQSSALHGNVKGDMDARQAVAVSAHLSRKRDSRAAIPLGGHRVRVSGIQVPTTQSCPLLPGSSPVETLDRAARSCTADILLLLPQSHPDLSSGWWHDLATLAQLADSAVVAPLLLAHDGKVLESGRAFTANKSVPLMRGFDAQGDGYNGSLQCNREVSEVPSFCVAVRRELVLSHPGDSRDWATFCLGLQALGLYHRICASVSLPTTLSWRAHSPDYLGTAPTESFLNPLFDPEKGDYTLAVPTGKTLHWHLDSSLPSFIPDGNLELRGWCFDPAGDPISLRIEVAGITANIRCNLPRPDVAASEPNLCHPNCGFMTRLKLEPGDHILSISALTGDGNVKPLLDQSVQIGKVGPLNLLFNATPQTLLTYQFLAGFAHAPLPLRPERFPRKHSKALPSFSIVTPSFQQHDSLSKTILSVLSETRIVCNYVVQDGGSTDGSVDLIRKHSDRLHAWESEPDAGQADAIAKGFARTEGTPDDIMAWINSDDFYLPGTLPYVADYFARHPEVDVIYGHRVLVDENSHEIGRWFLPRHDPEVLRLNDFVPQETLFWRRRIWDRVGGIDPSFKFAMDWDLLLRFQEAGARIVRVPYFLACFRIHSAQKTSSAMHSVGQTEIDLLRVRTHGRKIEDHELMYHPRLLRYLKRSALIEFLWKRGIRCR